MPTDTWQAEILKAARAWGVTANVDVELVGDDGSPLGTPATAGDPTFGNIRIGATTLSLGTVAVSVPLNPKTGTGSILLNDQLTYSDAPDDPSSGTYNLFSVATGQIGQVLGLDQGAPPVAPAADVSGQPQYIITGVLSGPTNPDFYRFQAPTINPGDDPSLTLMAWTSDSQSATPSLTLYDSNGQVVPTTGVLQQDGGVIVRLEAAQSGATYYLAVAASDPSAANTPYELTVETPVQEPPQAWLNTGTLSPSTPQDARSFVVTETQVLDFEFSASAPTDSGVTGVQVQVSDSNGYAYLDQYVSSGSTLSAVLKLGPGQYTVRFMAVGGTGSSLDTIDYTGGSRRLVAFSGPGIIDPDDPPAPPATNPLTPDPTDPDPEWIRPSYAPWTPIPLWNPWGRPVGLAPSNIPPGWNPYFWWPGMQNLNPDPVSPPPWDPSK
jgi:hypothetical protein